MIVSHAKNICVTAHECKRRVRPGWHTGRVTTVGTTTVGTAADSADSPVRGPLRPIELATGAVLGAVSVTLVVIAAVVPFAAALQLLAAVPFGVLAHRHRIRAVVAATVATLAVGFVAGGTSVVMSLMSCAVLGGIVGHVKRRRRGLGLMLLYSTVAALASAAFAVGLLLVFTNTRILFLDTVRDTARGMSDVAGRLPALEPAAQWFADAATSVVDWWWVWIGASAIAGVYIGAIFAWFVLGTVLDRLADLPGDDHLDAPTDPRPVAPLPVHLRDVSYRYPGARRDALSGVNLDVDRGEFVAIVGHNGSGKSTLARVLAGRPPTTGTLTRPGAPGLGEFGGTALVLQRPESQTLGVLVADDVVWGLPVDAEVDVAGLLHEVGLDGLAQRETASLSGGQQQRLAVAAALARRPSLLIADEATSMVDPDGRRELVDLLASLPARHDMAVVLITHQESEAAAADRVIHLAAGRTVDHLPDWAPALGTTIPRTSDSEPLLRLTDVQHTYLAGTPWATTALHGVDLTVHRGEGVLVVGGNGSGQIDVGVDHGGPDRTDRGALRTQRQTHVHAGRAGRARVPTCSPAVAAPHGRRGDRLVGRRGHRIRRRWPRVGCDGPGPDARRPLDRGTRAAGRPAGSCSPGSSPAGPRGGTRRAARRPRPGGPPRHPRVARPAAPPRSYARRHLARRRRNGDGLRPDRPTRGRTPRRAGTRNDRGSALSTVVLRRVPGDSVVHRLWAGTKLLTIVVISLVLMITPSWPVLAVTAAFLLVIVVIARIPPSAAPRLPWWFWALMFGVGLFNIPVGASAVLRYMQVLVFGLLLLGASFLVAWTTTLGEIAPAIASLAAPLRRLRLPVDEWAVAIALSLRSLPLLLDEMRILRAGRRLRPSGSGAHGARDNTLTDLITAVMAVALRRAGELGEAITARGGTGRLTAYPARPGRLDVLAAVAVAVYLAAAVATGILL